jgi:hypothetical protein
MAVGTRCADHVPPLYPQKLALTSPTGGGRSVGIVLSRTKATEFSLESDEIFSPSNKIQREVGRAKDLSAPTVHPGESSQYPQVYLF